jgi:hypothetical protein
MLAELYNLAYDRTDRAAARAMTPRAIFATTATADLCFDSPIGGASLDCAQVWYPQGALLDVQVVPKIEGLIRITDHR